MSDTINLTVNTQPQVTQITITEPEPITINMMPVAFVHPSVAQAKADAEAAEVAAEAAALQAQTIANNMVDQSIIYALIFG